MHGKEIRDRELQIRGIKIGTEATVTGLPIGHTMRTTGVAAVSQREERQARAGSARAGLRAGRVPGRDAASKEAIDKIAVQREETDRPAVSGRERPVLRAARGQAGRHVGGKPDRSAVLRTGKDRLAVLIEGKNQPKIIVRMQVARAASARVDLRVGENLGRSAALIEERGRIAIPREETDLAVVFERGQQQVLRDGSGQADLRAGKRPEENEVLRIEKGQVAVLKEVKGPTAITEKMQ